MKEKRNRKKTGKTGRIGGKWEVPGRNGKNLKRNQKKLEVSKKYPRSIKTLTKKHAKSIPKISRKYRKSIQKVS